MAAVVIVIAVAERGFCKEAVGRIRNRLGGEADYIGDRGKMTSPTEARETKLKKREEQNGAMGRSKMAVREQRE